MGELAKRVLERRRQALRPEANPPTPDPMEGLPGQAQESPHEEAFVDIVEVSEGSQNLHVEPLPTEAPEVRVEPVCPFRVGQVVSYKFPTNIRGAASCDWAYATGTIAEINHTLELATLYPNDEGDSWRMVPWVFIRADLEGHGDGLS